jgi:hypothetical protein
MLDMEYKYCVVMRNFTYLEGCNMPAEVHVAETLIYMQQCFMSHYCESLRYP